MFLVIRHKLWGLALGVSSGGYKVEGIDLVFFDNIEQLPDAMKHEIKSILEPYATKKKTSKKPTTSSSQRDMQK